MGARDTIPDLVSRIDGLIAILEAQDNKSHITVTHTQAGLSGWNVAAVCACFFTMFALIIALIVIVPDVHDAKAWLDHHSSQIAKMQSDIQNMQERK